MLHAEGIVEAGEISTQEAEDLAVEAEVDLVASVVEVLVVAVLVGVGKIYFQKFL